MTEISFYSGVANPLSATAKLVVKAYAQGRRVRVVTPDAAATATLDKLLWELEPEGFLPHVNLASPHAAKTPIIVDHAREHSGAIDVLINLGTEPYTIAPGERVAQLCIAPVWQAAFVPAATLNETERGEGGFGSTGK